MCKDSYMKECLQNYQNLQLVGGVGYNVFIMDYDVMFERERDWCLYFTALTAIVQYSLLLDMQTTQYLACAILNLLILCPAQVGKSF